MNTYITQTLKRSSYLLSGLVLLLQLFAPLSALAEGNNGTLKVHEKGTPVGTESNDTKVCTFNFEGFGFDPGQSGLIRITPQGGNPGATDTLNIPFGPANEQGYAETDYINDGNAGLKLSNGHYKGTLYGKDTGGEYTIDLKAKSNNFKVECPEGTIRVNKRAFNEESGKYEDADAQYRGFRWGIQGVDASPTRVMNTSVTVAYGTYTIIENSTDYEYVGWYYTGIDTSGPLQNQRTCSQNPRTGWPQVTVGSNSVDVKVTLCNKKTTQPKTGMIKVHKCFDEDSDNQYTCDDDAANELGFRWGINGQAIDRVIGFDGMLSDVPAGNVEITENNVSGWQFTGWYYTDDTSRSCNNPQGTTLPATITVSADTLVHVTFCNQKIKPKKGSITIIKDAIPNHAQDFEFEIEGNRFEKEFKLDDDEGAPGEDDKYSNSKTFTNLNAGKYEVSEEDEKGWKLVSIVCNDGSKTKVDLRDAEVEINLREGEDVTCVFTNKLTTKLVIKKDAQPNGPTDFTFSMTEHDDFLLDDDNDPTLSNKKAFNDINPGTYTITEAALEGWKLTSIQCSGTKDFVVDLENRSVTVTVKHGDTIECEFKNKESKEKPGSQLFGSKYNDLNGNGVWDEEEPTIGGWTIHLYKVCFPEEYYAPTSMSELMSRLKQPKVACEDELVTSTETNEDGQYSFDIPHTGGKYRVCEEQVEGWEQTQPANNGCYSVFVREPGEYGPYNFGNHQIPEPSITYTAIGVCIENFPYLSWSVVPHNFTPTAFTLDWLTAAGNNAGAPAGLLVHTQTYGAHEVDYDPDTNTYSALTLWPGANPIIPDWPGWKFENGQWVEDPSDFGGNLRPSADVRMSVNPTDHATATYPSQNQDCKPSQGNVLGASTELVNTGTPLLQGLLVAMSILGTASGVTYLNRRKQQA